MTVAEAKKRFRLGQTVTVNNPYWNGRRGTITPSNNPDGRHIIDHGGRAIVHITFGRGEWDNVDADQLK